MKNSARRSSGSNKGNKNSGKAQKNKKDVMAPSDAAVRDPEAAAAAEAAKLKEQADIKAADKAAKAGREVSGDKVLYRVDTRRDSSVLLAYITFTYRAYHPQVTGRMLFYGLLIAVPGFITKIQALKIALWVIGALVILLGLTRQYISLALTKRSDADYRSGAGFTYEFTANNASFYKNGEIFRFLGKYKDIDGFYYDEDFYYMSLRTREFFILPKKRFTSGDPAEFEHFIYSRCRQTCKWIPNKFSNKMKKRRAARAVSGSRM